MKSHQTSPASNQHYRHLAIMVGISFLAMFILMYAMVDAFSNVYVNVNQVYMAALMCAPMALIELAVMRAMYQDRRKNVAIVVASLVVLAGSFLGIRAQAAVGDRQFLRSMIPHHGGAVLMCGQATIRDAEIMALCRNIQTGQQAEIEQMKGILRRLGSK